MLRIQELLKSPLTTAAATVTRSSSTASTTSTRLIPSGASARLAVADARAIALGAWSAPGTPAARAVGFSASATGGATNGGHCTSFLCCGGTDCLPENGSRRARESSSSRSCSLFLFEIHFAPLPNLIAARSGML